MHKVLEVYYVQLRPSGFTLIELIAVIVILGVVSALAVPRFFSFAEDAQAAHVARVLTALKAGEQLVQAQFYAAGSPGQGVNANQTLTIDGIPVRFRNGQIRTTLNSAHVPTVPQNRNAAYTRLFFLFLQGAPADIVARNSPDRGWAMLGNNNACAAGPNPRRCWEYRVGGARVARITYFTTTGTFAQD
ncbi:prepilin-type N-terminal cleavage/methylation domain-containing protein [Simiduia agarivorans]|uniref:prepilin-type N-terminal cleavage/methylation domain-containing protein n=1 Tax=Simiduia agarivorans TaxID=447471 RepID=UPI00138AEDF4|nr:prepilin-type N-terminal cleavage/methylation domain-containing protein [Simiduia agarivorans]